MSQVVQLASGDLPPARDFFLSAGFAGITALLAAVIVVCAVLFVSRRAGKRFVIEREENDRRHEQRRDDELRAEAVARCWDRWWQVLNTAALEPAASEGATLGLGPEVTLVLLKGLLHDAEQLGDDTLTKAIAVYREQLVLVLAQQSGPLSKLAAPPAASPNGGPASSTPSGKHVSGNAGAAARESAEPAPRPKTGSSTRAAAQPATAETPSAAQEDTAGKRR